MKKHFGLSLGLLLILSLSLFVLVSCGCDHLDKDDNGICDKCGDEFSDGSDLHTKASKGLSYTKVDNTYILSGRGSCTDTNIVIPSEYNGLPVTGIESAAFFYSSSLKSITIPKTITSIGSMAFFGCFSLDAVYIYDIAQWCTSAYASNPLHYAQNLYLLDEKGEANLVTDLVIPDGITNIGNSFAGCDSLTSITIPQSVTSIGKSVFSGCSSLNSITIPNSVTSIGENAFSGCSSLTSITIPQSVTSIGKSAFSGCSSLNSITIPNSVTSINEETFYECYALTAITIPESVTSIGRRAFYRCCNLSSVAISKQSRLQQIESEAFYECDSLISITIPEGVTGIESFAFKQCYKLIEVINHSSLEIRAGNSSNGSVAFYAKEVHSSESKINKNGDFLFYSLDGTNYLCDYIGTENHFLQLPTLYKEEGYVICQYAFHHIYVSWLFIPKSVTSIEENAFKYVDTYSVLFDGTAEEWKNIPIAPHNDTLTEAEHYYYSEEEPSEEGNFWHYDENGVIEIW